ncbi:MAG: S1/P1 Nuclease [Candidatus Rokuibacteriota bacterium]|nr:MAG: S1/P1 Nuclease [Candidatus Rokubacteria bacterium]
MRSAPAHPPRAPQDLLEATQNVFALSVKDLLEARDLYHNHLLHKQNVVGTAIGLYFRRRRDRKSYLKMSPRDRARDEQLSKGERTFQNSSVKDSSWPCVLVFVSQWIRRSDFGTGKKLNPRHIIPPALYLPDGRVVPVCVMKVSPSIARPAPLARLSWPTSMMGGGFPLVCEVQGQERVASVGCLVTDGHNTYALSNRHVTGPAGVPVFTELRGTRVEIGRSSEKQLTRLPFSEAYPQYPGSRTFLNVDVGLIDVNDVNDWTSQVYGLGPIGELADLSEQNISLRLIDEDVVAYGAASGKLRGKIKALFYRYKSVGGYDYVADFLIAPDPTSTRQTLSGDSGTVWHVPATETSPPRPLAIEWGAQTLLSGVGEQPLSFALATSLSTVCRRLDVELVREHNTGAAPFWGVTGHYSIATFAIDAARIAKVKKLMSLNRARISFDASNIDPEILADQMREAKKNGSFVPLADVPDVIWKQFKNSVDGGRDPVPRKGPEHPTHFADIDQPRADGKTLRALSLANPANVSVAFWRAFYTSLGHTDSRSRGLLPFRVWQFFDAMVAAVKAKQLNRFVCAAGILSHYVGDACQPLHGSMFADGFQDQAQTVPMTHRDGTPGTKQVWPGMGIHSAYESAMIDRKAVSLLAGLQTRVTQLAALPRVANGHEAAVAIVGLMERSAVRLPPSVLINEYIGLGGGKSAAALDGLWTKFGPATIETMADGANVLAMLWDSAWAAGNGSAIVQSSLKIITKPALKALYTKADFVESLDLDAIGPSLV